MGIPDIHDLGRYLETVLRPVAALSRAAGIRSPSPRGQAAIALISPPKTPTVSLHSFLQGVRVAGYSPGPFVSLRSPSGCGLRARPFPVVPS